MERLADLLRGAVLLGLLYPVFTDIKYRKVDMRYMIWAIRVCLLLQLCILPFISLLTAEAEQLTVAEQLKGCYTGLFIRMALSLPFGGIFWLLCDKSGGRIGSGDGAVFFLLASCFIWRELFWVLVLSLLFAAVVGLLVILLLRRGRTQKIAFVPILWAVSFCICVWQG